MTRVQEYAYRKEFGLSKAEMAEEPIEDIVINQEIIRLINKKQQREQSILEAQAKRK